MSTMIMIIEKQKKIEKRSQSQKIWSESWRYLTHFSDNFNNMVNMVNMVPWSFIIVAKTSHLLD